MQSRKVREFRSKDWKTPKRVRRYSKKQKIQGRPEKKPGGRSKKQTSFGRFYQTVSKEEKSISASRQTRLLRGRGGRWEASCVRTQSHPEHLKHFRPQSARRRRDRKGKCDTRMVFIGKMHENSAPKWEASFDQRKAIEVVGGGRSGVKKGGKKCAHR